MKYYGKTGMCHPCYNETQKELPDIEIKDNHAVYHIPSVYYVGRSSRVRERLKQHKNNGINIEDYVILSWHETEEEAAKEEMRWHLKGYHGNQGLRQKLKRELYG